MACRLPRGALGDHHQVPENARPSSTLLTCREEVGGGGQGHKGPEAFFFFSSHPPLDTDLDVLRFPLCWLRSLSECKPGPETKVSVAERGGWETASPQEAFKKPRPPVGMIRDQFKGHFGRKKAHAASGCVGTTCLLGRSVSL